MAVVAPQGQSNQEETEQQPTGQPQQLAGSSQSGQSPAGGRLASFSSGSAPGSQGSGRFTNLSKYIDANKGASESLGNRANSNFNRNFNAGEQNVSKQNEQIAQGFQKGRASLDQGSGYQNQLNQIGQGLNSFQAIDNRGDFDTAGQQAQTLAGDQNFTTLASGQAVDQNALQTSQAAAQNSAQNLYNTNQTNLQNLQTNAGRDNLLNTLTPKQGYSSGQRSFDKLFLTGGVLNNLQGNLQGKQGVANTILQGTTGQQKTLDQLVGDENNIVKALTTSANSNQDIFNAKFGDMKNVEAVNVARTQRFNDLKSGLTSGGSISQEDMQLLGLDKLGSTFINDNSPTVSGNISEKVGTGDPALPVGTGINRIGTYNLLKDPSSVNNYITQGANAQNIQDITTQGDYDAYKALQALALGRDTGMLSGVSTLGNSVNVKGNLAKDIQDKDTLFRDTYGNKTYQAAATNYGDEYRDQLYGGFGMQDSSSSEAPSNLQDYLNTQSDKGAGSIGNFIQSIRSMQGLAGVNPSDYLSTNGNFVDKGASSVAQGNLADYLKSGNINTLNKDLYDNGINGDTIKTATTNQVKSDVQGRLENVLNTEGTRNALTVGENKNYKRFKGLV